MRKLDVLNELLAKETGLPTFRRSVTETGGGLEWLRKAFKHKPPASYKLQELVQLNLNQLKEKAQ